MKYLNFNQNWVFFSKNDLNLYEFTSPNILNYGSSFESNFESRFFFLINLNKKIKLKKNRTRSSLMNKFVKDHNQFVKIFNKDGLLLKYHLLIIDMLIMHRQFFETLNVFFNEQYQSYYPFYIFAKTNYSFYNFSFLLNFVSTIIDPCIQVKVITLPKFIQKKYRKKYDFQVKHVNNLLRKRYVFKRILINSNYINYNKVQQRLYISLINIFLKPNTNLVHVEKINFYKYALKTYKSGLLKLVTT